MKDAWIRLQGDKEFWVLEIWVDSDRSEKRRGFSSIHEDNQYMPIVGLE